MKFGKMVVAIGVIALMASGSALHADQHAPAQSELASRLAGAVFTGVYLRAGTPYRMDFGVDGTLTDSAGREGRWWVNEAEEYCREWTSGPMAGVTTCMEVIVHLGRVAIFSGDEKVLEGELITAQ